MVMFLAMVLDMTKLLYHVKGPIINSFEAISAIMHKKMHINVDHVTTDINLFGYMTHKDIVMNAKLQFERPISSEPVIPDKRNKHN